MRPIKFTEENIKRVFSSFAYHDGFELEICQPDDLYPCLYAKIKCSVFSVKKGANSLTRSTISCSVISNIPSNWYWFVACDIDGFPYIMFDGSYTV